TDSLGTSEASRRNANDHAWLVAHYEMLPDHVRIAPELGLPQLGADHRDILASRRMIFGLSVEATDHGMHTESWKQIPGGETDRHVVRCGPNADSRGECGLIRAGT